MDVEAQSWWQAQDFVGLGVQISWQAQDFVDLEAQISWQAQDCVDRCRTLWALERRFRGASPSSTPDPKVSSSRLLACLLASFLACFLLLCKTHIESTKDQRTKGLVDEWKRTAGTSGPGPADQRTRGAAD